MTQQRRLLFVVNAFESDAPTRLTVAIAVAAKHRGWDVTFLAWARGGETEQHLINLGIATSVLGRGMVSNALALHRIIKTYKPDIIHTALARPTLGCALSRLFPRNTSPLWVAADHGVHEWHEKGPVLGRFMDFLMPAILTSPDCVTTVSRNARSQLAGRGVPPERLHVISNGVDVRRFYPALRRNRDHLLHACFPNEPAANIRFLIGASGNLRQIKGHDILLRAIPAVLARFPDVRFIIWGEGPERANLTRLTKELNIEHAVAFPGHERAIETHLPLLDIYVQPSRVDSFGLGAAEAMACGLPVIVSTAGGLPELIQHGTTGRTFKSEDHAALADEILDLLQHPHKREALGDAARLHILQHFSQQGMTSAMLALYEQLLQKREAQHERN